MKLNLNELQPLIKKAQTMTAPLNTLQQCYALTDLTRLADPRDKQAVIELCEQVQALPYPVAAICIYPAFIKQALQQLNHIKINIATVCNFPSGDIPWDKVKIEIETALSEGADEIDLVMPYRQYLQNRTQAIIDFVSNAKQLCQQKKLKIILETGAFTEQQQLFQAAIDMINAGADFLKTSTGKITVGATLESAAILMKAIQITKREVGFKASGGIRTLAQANSYLALAGLLLGPEFVNPERFRFGTSQPFAEV